MTVSNIYPKLQMHIFKKKYIFADCVHFDLFFFFVF